MFFILFNYKILSHFVALIRLVVNLLHFSLKISHLVATILMIFLKIN